MAAGPSNAKVISNSGGHRKRAAPDHEGQRIHLAGAAHHQIGGGPGGGGQQQQQQAERRGRSGGLVQAVPADQRHTRGCQHHRHALGQPHPFARDEHGQTDGEEHLALHHQRGQARRHVSAHGPEQQAELARAQQHAKRRQPPPRDTAGRGMKKIQGSADSEKRSAASRKGGNSASPHLMTTKLVPPDKHHGQGKKQVTDWHEEPMVARPRRPFDESFPAH
jgi:hypothetical protein